MRPSAPAATAPPRPTRSPRRPDPSLNGKGSPFVRRAILGRRRRGLGGLLAPWAEIAQAALHEGVGLGRGAAIARHPDVVLPRPAQSLLALVGVIGGAGDLVVDALLLPLLLRGRRRRGCDDGLVDGAGRRSRWPGGVCGRSVDRRRLVGEILQETADEGAAAHADHGD